MTRNPRILGHVAKATPDGRHIIVDGSGILYFPQEDGELRNRWEHFVVTYEHECAAVRC